MLLKHDTFGVENRVMPCPPDQIQSENDLQKQLKVRDYREVELLLFKNSQSDVCLEVHMLGSLT